MVKNVILAIAASMIVLNHESAHAQHWNLPAALAANSMKITFELSTTWHNVQGVVKELSGTARLSNPKDPRSITARIIIPVAALDTDSASRDEEMRDSMEAERFPSIRVEVPAIVPSCEERSLSAESACTYSTKGTVTIRDVTLPIALSGGIHRDDAGAILVDGSTQLDWSKFGVKDPSILVARVDEEVKIAFRITLPSKKK